MQPNSDEKTVWMEITKSTNDHGGEGWEFGTCLWSPCTAQAGGDRYRVMRLPKRGEPVIHCYDAVYMGVSRVSEECMIVDSAPPRPAPWTNCGIFYRIELSNYRPFPHQLSRSQFISDHSEKLLAEIEAAHPSRYPFIYHTRRITTVQGQFLTIVTPKLLGILIDALSIDDRFILDPDEPRYL